MAMSFARSAIVLGLLAAVGPLAIDMYLPGAADDCDRPQHVDRRRSGDPHRLLHRLWRQPDRLWPDLGHGRPQAAALFRARSVHCRRGRLPALAERRVADLLPLYPGARRRVRHGGAARGHPRPAYRHRGDAPDVAGHAGAQRVADPGAARRQRPHRAVRMARGVRRRDHRGGRRPVAGDVRSAGDVAGSNIASGPASAASFPVTASSSAIAASWD